MDIEEIREKIEVVRNDTNAYGFDNDNLNLADVLEYLIDRIGNGGSFLEDENSKEEISTASGDDFD